MKTQTQSLLFLVLLSITFTVGLTFASVELPRLLDTVLDKNFDTPDVATGLNEVSDFKTELYLQYFHLRLIGYSCLTLILILIVAGFVTEKTGWTSAGAFLLFLPVFGHFAATMFFLGGLGFLRLLWLPALDISFDLFRLGDIINLPYRILETLSSFVGLHRWIDTPLLLTGTGLLIFCLGTFTWFYTRLHGIGVADFWVYRLSRHPQYLGWIVWSYGVMFLPGSNIKLCYGLSNSLPWLLSTMIILGVAMMEELKMRRVHGETYASYAQHAPFLFPLPRFLGEAFNLPLRLIFKKEYPERKGEILAVLAFYTAIALGTSALYGRVVPLPERTGKPSLQRIEELARTLKDAKNHADKRSAAAELEKIGEPAMASLIALLSDPDPVVRAYAAGALGGRGSELVVSPLVPLLHDDDPYVRRMAAATLGRTGSPRAIQPLTMALQDQAREVAAAAAQALGGIRHPDVLPPLIRALRDTIQKTDRPAAIALGELGTQEGIEPLVRCLEEAPNCPYDAVGDALWKLNSDRAVDAWIAGLKRGSWWFPRASCATALGRNRIEKGIRPLQEALKDESREVRRAAVLALMEFHSERTVDALRRAQEDEDLEVRMYAKEALRRIEAGNRK